MLQRHAVVRIGVVCLLGLATPLRSVAAQEARVPCEPDAGDKAAAPELMFNLVRHNFEPSYLAYPFALSGLPPLLVEANIAPHFTVGRASWPLAFVLTPKIRVRMFRARSTPVHTPSYMPRAALFAWLKHDLEPNAATAYASLAISHHSNGEDRPAVDAAGRSNHTSGDFSTNFLELAVYETRSRARLFGWNKRRPAGRRLTITRLARGEQAAVLFLVTKRWRTPPIDTRRTLRAAIADGGPLENAQLDLRPAPNGRARDCVRPAGTRTARRLRE